MKTTTNDLNALLHVDTWTGTDGETLDIFNRCRTNLLARVSPATAQLGDEWLTIRLHGASDYHAADLADELRRAGVPCRRDRTAIRVPRGFVAALNI